MRVTRVGSFIRKYRLDELGQLIDVFRGTMTFVGTRPEVSKYVEQYAPKMWATLLLPAGITSEGSIYYKDEGELLADSTDIDKTYIEDILPNKMFYNLEEIEKLNMKAVRTELLLSDPTNYQKYSHVTNAEDFLQSLYIIFHGGTIGLLEVLRVLTEAPSSTVLQKLKSASSEVRTA